MFFVPSSERIDCMNTEEKKDLFEKELSAGTEAFSEEPKKNPHHDPEHDEGGVIPPRHKRSKQGIALFCAFAFLVLYTIVNASVFGGFFSAMMSVLTPIILGAALAYMLNPILKLFEFKIFKNIKNKNVLRGLSLLMTYIVAILIVVAFLLLIVPQLIESITYFASKFDQYMTTTVNTLNGFISKIMKNDSMNDVIQKETILQAISQLISKSGDLFSGIMGYIVEYGMGLVVGIKNTVLAIFISIYILSSKECLNAQCKKLTTALFSPKGRRRFYRYVRLCDRTFGGFFVGKIIDSLIIGVITAIVLLIFQMPYVLLVSAIVCITNVIPVFGPFIGAIPSFFIIFIASPSKGLLFLVLILLIQQLDGNVIGPKILGNSTNLSSLGVIISIIIMGEFFGVVGMIVGVPIFAVGVALAKEMIEHRLRKKELSTDTADYYARDSLVDPHEVHETYTQKLIKRARAFFHKLSAKRNNSKKEIQAKEKEENE